jgi:hypothetical protein
MKPDLNHKYPELEKVFGEMVALTCERMGLRKPKSKCGHMRGQHAKATGFVKAEFRIADDLPAEFRHGVFAQPGRIFDAVVRFSNSDGTVEEDKKKAARGMAIKLRDIGGTPRAMAGDEDRTQDFLMVNHPVFPFRNPQAYLDTMKWIVRGEHVAPGIGKLLGIIHMALFGGPALKIAKAIQGKRLASPLKMTYWSGTPYWLGSATGEEGQAVKYQAVPRHPAVLLKAPKDYHPKHDPDESLKLALVEHLEKRDKEAVFDFNVQAGVGDMSIDDVSQEWDENESEPVTVATLRIPPQKVETDAGEPLSFSPWHALKEHCPLGGMNWLRKLVYAESVRVSERSGRCPVQAH